MKKNELYVDKRIGHIWRVEKIYEKPSVLLKDIETGNIVIDTIENFENLGMKKLN